MYSTARPVTLLALFVASLLFVEAMVAQQTDKKTDGQSDKQIIQTPSGFFTTRANPMALPLPKAEDAFQFVVYGDRTGGSPEGVDVLRQAVSDTNLLDPDFVLTVGDLIQGYNRPKDWMVEMQEFRDVMGKLKMTWFPVAGNHDIYWDFRDPKRPNGHHEDNYEKHFGPLWYSFEHKNSAFIVLYTDEGDPDTGEKAFNQARLQMMSGKQIAFLKEALARYKDKTHVFVAMHHPRWAGGGYSGSNWPDVHKLLVAAKNVKAVFAGHIHRMRYDPKDGIDYFALATTGGHLSADLPEVGYLHHYNVVTVRPEGITVATFPVGAAIDPTKFKPEFLTDANAVRGITPTRVGDQLPINLNGTTANHYRMAIPNPGKHPIEVSMTPKAAKGWQVAPDHQHVTIAPGKTSGVDFYYYRGKAANSSAADAWPGFAQPSVAMSIDYLHPDARIRYPAKTIPVDIGLAKVEASTFDKDLGKVLSLSGKAQPDTRRTLAKIKTDCVRVTSDELKLPQGPFTLEAWVYPTAIDGSRAVVAKTQAAEFAIFLHDGLPNFDVHLGKYVSPRHEKKISLNQWTHLAGVYDGQNVKLFVNGKLAQSLPGSGDRTRNKLPLFIGADPDGYSNPTRPFAGKLDEVRLSKGVRYTEEFTPDQRHISDESTVLLLHLDRQTGPFLLDNSTPATNVLRFGGATISDR